MRSERRKTRNGRASPEPGWSESAVDFYRFLRRVWGVNELSADTRKRLAYVAGWLQLGCMAEARVELAGVAAEEREHPAVLTLELETAMAAQTWKKAMRLAARLRELAPGLDAGWLHGAFATRRAGKAGRVELEKARGILEAAEERIGARCSILHYNLACYAALLGDLEAARARLARAVQMEPGCAKMARTDEDLAGLFV